MGRKPNDPNCSGTCRHKIFVYCIEITEKAENLDGRKAIRVGKAERVENGRKGKD
jgi:hypothetical protein